jgi:hypothetical protein
MYVCMMYVCMYRGNLEDVVVKEAYDDVLAKTAPFFAEHLAQESVTSK